MPSQYFDSEIACIQEQRDQSIFTLKILEELMSEHSTRPSTLNILDDIVWIGVDTSSGLSYNKNALVAIYFTPRHQELMVCIKSRNRCIRSHTSHRVHTASCIVSRMWSR